MASIILFFIIIVPCICPSKLIVYSSVITWEKLPIRICLLDDFIICPLSLKLNTLLYCILEGITQIDVDVTFPVSFKNLNCYFCKQIGKFLSDITVCKFLIYNKVR